MFSEYASRFLSQSQSRPPYGAEDRSPSHNRPQSSSRFANTNFLRPNMNGPYAPSGSRISRFGFTSPTRNQQAPLFHPSADEFREEDDGEEHQREVADFYALQKSRRGVFGPSQLTDSSEGGEYTDHEDKVAAIDSEEEDHRFERPRGRGIRSSWRGEADDPKGRQKPPTSAPISTVLARQESVPASEPSTQNHSHKGKLVDIELTNSEHSSIEDLNQEEDYGPDGSAPAYSGFHFKSQHLQGKQSSQSQSWMPEDSNDETARLYTRPRSPGVDSVLPGIAEEESEEFTPVVPKHDEFWGMLFLIAFASIFASAFLVYLHTDEPSKKKPLGDTIYTILRKSFHLLGVDTLVSIIIAAVWLLLLRTYLRPLAYLTILAVPILLFSFALWPFVTSLKGTKGKRSAQDKVMTAFSFIPFLGAIVWTYMTIQSRHSIERSIKILELASRILTASPALITSGFAALAATVAWFWLWLVMFTRVFLEGHMTKNLFIIDLSTWWLGILFFLMLLWTQLVISGIQRATTAATVSQWYFYRTADTVASSRDVVLASLTHATGPLFGTVALSSLIALLIRLPLLLLPRRLTTCFAMCIYSMTPAPLAALTNPLTLTHAAIHSQPLAVAARGLTRLPLDSSPARSFRAPRPDALAAYRTTHLLLHATRQVMTLALGVGAWVNSARGTRISDSYVGSAYAYVVGLGAAVVGWSTLGAVEGILGGVVDAVLVCWGSEVAAGNKGRKFCVEAEELFGEEETRTTGRIMV